MKRVFVCALFIALAASLSQATYDHSYKFKAFNDLGKFITVPGLDIGLEVYQDGSKAVFKIFNSSTIACSVCDIYFDGEDLPKISSLDWSNQKGVKFSLGANPGNLPGGNTLNPKFVTNTPSSVYSLDSDSPVSKNGINPGEWLKVKFDLKNIPLTQLINALDNGNLRVGIHIQAFSDGSSLPAVNESNMNPPDVPEPATLGLLGFGLASWFSFRKKGRF
jgi:hypothetical protein